MNGSKFNDFKHEPSEELKIESDIPTPVMRHWTRWPRDRMEVGQSFLIKLVKRGSLLSAIHYYGKKHPLKRFSVRKVDDFTYRCFRIENGHKRTRADGRGDQTI